MAPLMGKVALVTGGGRGIGAAVARRLAADGAAVALTYASAQDGARAVARDIEADGGRAVVLQTDLAEPGAAAEAVGAAVATLGQLDVLVNNAAYFARGALDEITLEDVDRTLAVNVRAAFLAAQAAARHMGPGGRIITIGTTVAGRVPVPGMSLFAMSKAALNGLTRGLARDLGPRGITATIVHPGPIDTHANPADSPQASVMGALTALGHYGRPDDVAATVAHLAGEGGRYITGAAIAVDGGFAT
ncbi:SDR family oxidoreductase [Dactylosporangium sp. CA-139066]|uniref:SDR family oxidoreductase n=1 Tax=Dactylosporangium sp. CA-139066 TaxID=3239930 RepID=UPI003D91732A